MSKPHGGRIPDSGQRWQRLIRRQYHLRHLGVLLWMGQAAQFATAAHGSVVVVQCATVGVSRIMISGRRSTFDMPAA